MYLADRDAFIGTFTDLFQLSYIRSEFIPADFASRSCNAFIILEICEMGLFLCVCGIFKCDRSLKYVQQSADLFATRL